MVIYDVYEELEKPDEWEILFINNVLNGEVGISSFDGMGEIFHTSCNIKNDNSDVIIDEVSYEDVTSWNMVDKFQLEEEDYTYHYNQYLLCKENDVNNVTEIFKVSRLFAKGIKFLKRHENLSQDSRTSPFQREEYDAGASNSFYIQYSLIEKQTPFKSYVYFGADLKSPLSFGFKPPWTMKTHFTLEAREGIKACIISLYDIQVYN